jgi:hypothetical protein
MLSEYIFTDVGRSAKSGQKSGAQQNWWGNISGEDIKTVFQAGP